MKIALDAMGGDFAPVEVIKGAVEAAGDPGLEVVLVGDQEVIERELNALSQPLERYQVIHTDEVVGMDEHPAMALRQKPRSSVRLACQAVKEGRAAGMVSAGNSGATMAAATLTLGRLGGIDRPALAAVLPAVKGQVMLLDLGANADCKPAYLQQFALVGSVYMEKVWGIANPRVGLLSIGEEETKGNALVLEAHQLLKSTPVNFIGNVEGRDIPAGNADVVVCDGFVGNVVLKFGEGLAEGMITTIRAEISKSLLAKLAALALRPAFRRVRRRLDFAEYGGAPLLGLRGVVIVTHGRARARAVANAIRAARRAAEQHVVDATQQGLAALTSVKA